MEIETTTTRHDEVQEFVGWQVGLRTDWMANCVTHGRILPIESESEVAIEFSGLGKWIVPIGYLTLPTDSRVRWFESFACVRADMGLTLETIAIEVQKPADDYADLEEQRLERMTINCRHNLQGGGYVEVDSQYAVSDETEKLVMQLMGLVIDAINRDSLREQMIGTTEPDPNTPF